MMRPAPESSLSHSSPGRAGAGPTVTGWFAQMSLMRRPALWIPVLLLLAVAAYHVGWLAGDLPYSVSAMITVLVGVAVAALLVMLIRADALRLGVCVRFFLSAAGLAATALGVALLAGPASIGTPTTTEIVGGLALLCGVFGFSAGIYLTRTIDRPSAIGQGPRHLAEERFDLNGMSAVLRRFAGFGVGTHRLVDLCREYVTVTDLNFVAYFMDGECRFHLDVLADSRVDRFSDQVTPDARRSRYLQQARYLHRAMVGLNDSFLEIDAGILIRVVLDVERGALYYYWIDDRRFVIGVTLDQEMVDQADRRMVQIVDGIRVSLGHKRITDLER